MLKLMFKFKQDTIIYLIANVPDIMAIFIKILNYSSNIILSKSNNKFLRLMIMCRPDIIIYLIKNVPDIMINFKKNRNYDEIFKFTNNKIKHQQTIEIYRKNCIKFM